ncbi:hypothetical protein [Marinomonas sp. PE14-40]|uniref:hypothetical protein n=1 Tax=Marinomonas sp. PE14-40 TaxID=3060621 RepID=UPI003F66F058
MDRQFWALSIGHFIISMNEIDHLTSIIRLDILEEDLSKNWNKTALTVKLKKQITALSEADNNYPELIKLLNEALELCGMRNLAAHGTFALDGRLPPTEGKESQYSLYSIKHEHPVTKEEIEMITKKAIQLSDSIAERIALISMSKNREKRASKGAA